MRKPTGVSRSSRVSPPTKRSARPEAPTAPTVPQNAAPRAAGSSAAAKSAVPNNVVPIGSKSKSAAVKPARNQSAKDAKGVSARVAPTKRLARLQGPTAARLKQEQKRLRALAKQDKVQSKLGNRAQLEQIRRFTSASRLRRAVVFSSLGSVLLLVALVLATMFTPLMAIDTIKITGVHRMKIAAIRNAVNSLKGTPLTLVNEAALAKRLSGFPLIESFTTISLPPHTLELDILERQPIGLVQMGGNTYLYDPAGVRIGPARRSSVFPLILVNGDPRSSTNYREAVDVLLALPASLYPKIYSIQATTKDDVHLTIRGISNRHIIWGDASQSLLKSKVLAALMANTKHTATVTFDVSSPTTPTVRYGAY